MIDLVEARAEIALDEPFCGVSMLPDCSQGRMASAVRSEPVRTVAELRLIIGFQDGADDLLKEFIRPSWKAPRSCAFRLGI